MSTRRLAAVATLLVAGLGAGALAQEQTTRTTTPGGVTVTYPSAASGLPHGYSADMAGPGTAGGLGPDAAPPSAAMPGLGSPSPTIYARQLGVRNRGPVQAFASGAPNAAIDQAPPPPSYYHPPPALGFGYYYLPSSCWNGRRC